MGLLCDLFSMDSCQLIRHGLLLACTHSELGPLCMLLTPCVRLPAAQGTFFNDVYILDVHTFTWSRPQQLNPAPPPRYHHCCFSIDSKVLIYGGINTTQAFEGVVVLETNFGTELSAVADELFKMSAAAGAIATGGPTMSRGSGSSSTGGTGTAGSSSMSMAGMGAGGGAAAAGAHPLVSDLMKLQLRDLLVKRNMEEMHVSAGRKVGMD